MRGVLDETVNGINAAHALAPDRNHLLDKDAAPVHGVRGKHHLASMYLKETYVTARRTIWPRQHPQLPKFCLCHGQAKA